MVKALEIFIKQQGQTVQQLDRFFSQTHHSSEKSYVVTPAVREREEDSIHRLLQDSAALKSIIDERVREILQQMSTGSGPRIYPQRAVSASTIQGPSSDSDVYSKYSDNSSKPQTPQHSTGTRFKGQERFSMIEPKMLDIWSLVLGIAQDSIRKDDNFFELGGDSIAAMELVGAVRDNGLILTVADVFRNPIFKDMTEVACAASGTNDFILTTNIGGRNGPNPAINASSDDLHERFTLLETVNVDNATLLSRICPTVGVFRGGIADVLPVTDFQALAIAGAILGSRSMLNYFFLDGSGKLDLRRLRQSCSQVVRTFDILRTVFLCTNDRFLQVILRKARPEFRVYETDSSLDEFTATLLQQDRETDPQQGEHFVQFIVVKARSIDAHRILIRLSHAQYDGVCLPKILSAIKAGYEGGLIPPAPSFASFVRESAKVVASEHYQYWKALLKDSSMTQIVHQKGPKHAKSTGAATATLKERIRLPPIAHGNITTATVIKSAWALALAKLTSTRDVVFGHTISGRNASFPGIEATIGPCVNVIPVRVQFKDNWSALDLLRYVQDQQVANMPFETLGFREIIKHCTGWHDWTTFSTIVQHQNDVLQDKILVGDNLYRVGCVGNDDNFADVSILSMPQNTGKDMVEIMLSFSLDGPISESLAERLLNMTCDMAKSFASNPSMLLSLPSVPSTSLQRMIPDVVDEQPRSPARNKNLDRAEFTILSDLLTQTWQRVLTDKGGNFPSVQLSSSFFDLGGDIVNLAQVVWLLEQEGLKVRLDDLIGSPRLFEQIDVLVSCRLGSCVQEAPAPSPATVESSPPPAQGRISRFWTAIARKAQKRS
jgi:aryl carrier-like protein